MFKLIRPDVLNGTRACFAANVQTFFHSFHFPAIFLHFFHSNACQIKFLLYLCTCKHHNGVLAHLARARHWQCRGERFESAMLHKKTSLIIAIQGRFFVFTARLTELIKKLFILKQPLFGKIFPERSRHQRLPDLVVHQQSSNFLQSKQVDGNIFGSFLMRC